MASRNHPSSTVPAEIRALVRGRIDEIVVRDVYDEAGSAIYDDLCRNDTHETRELVTLTRHLPGDLLELASGAGRLTLPLLAAGHHVVALELSAAMVDLLHGRLREVPGRMRERCEVVHGDMTGFDLGRRFGAVVLGTTSISLLDADGRHRLYACVARHLADDGRFLVSTVDLAGRDRDTGTVRRVRGVSGRSYHLAELVSADATSRTVAILPAGPGSGRPEVYLSVVQVLPVATLTAELAEHGFGVLAVHQVHSDDDRYRTALVEAGTELPR